MKPEFEIVSRLLLCGLDVLMSYNFFQSMFSNRIGKVKLCIYLAITSLGIFGVNSIGNSIANFLLVPILYFLFSIMVFNISLYKCIAYTIIYFIIFACGREMAFEMLYRLLMAVFPQLGKRFFPPNGMLFLFAEYLLSFLFLLFIGKHTKKLEISEDSKADWYLLIMPAASILILFSFVYMDFPRERFTQLLICGGAFLLYFSNAVIFVILADFSRVMNKAKMAELFLLKKDMDKNYFESVEKANSIYRKYMHDIHQYFYQLRNLAVGGENELIVDIIDNIEGKIKSDEDRKIFADSPVLNSVFSVYYSRAKARKIEIQFFVEEGIKVDFIQDDDKISMFGNLLDNAVEAASKCKESERKINVRLYMGSRYILVFEMENSWTKIPFKKEEKIISTKKDSLNHGLGINIVKELAAKYGGELELTEREEWFVTILLVSNYFHKC